MASQYRNPVDSPTRTDRIPSGRTGVAIGTIASLALHDVFHERLLSTCLIVACAGLLAPLLILFGLKSGVMQTLRSELVEDPAFREIRPESTDIYDRDLIDRLRNLSQTEFVVGSVSRGASVIRLDTDSDTTVFADMLPTAHGDPLLLHAGTRQSDRGVVISHSIAEKLRLTSGDLLYLSTERMDPRGAVTAQVSLPVDGILPAHRDSLDRVYVPAELAFDFESFREGFAVGSRGWGGANRDADPAYHGVVLALSTELDDLAFARITNNTDFYLVERMGEAAYRTRFGSDPPPAAVQLLDVRVIDSPAGDSSVLRVKRNVSSTLITASPYVDALSVDVQLPDDSWRKLVAQIELDTSLEDDQIRLPASLDEQLANSASVEIRVQAASGQLQLPLRRGAAHQGPGIRLNARLAGLLQRSFDRPLTFDADRGGFVLESLGFRGFRLFARTLDEVETLVRYVEAQGIEVVSSVREIRRLQRLDKGLTALFSLIALASAITGAIVLLASQYGAVERKRGSLARLRLIGLTRTDVALTPIFQGLFIALTGIALAGAMTLMTCSSMNIWLADVLGFSGTICRLEPEPLGIGAALALLLSLTSASGAALRATRIDPAEGMRDE